MKSITLICPFTGVEFEALQSEDGKDYIFTNPLTGQTLQAKDGKINTTVAELFATQKKSVSPAKAAEMLGVTRQRITQLLREGKLPYYLVNGSKRILENDVLEYRKNR